MTADVQRERPTSTQPGGSDRTGSVGRSARDQAATSAAAAGRPPIEVRDHDPEVLKYLRSAGVPPRFEDRRLGGFRDRPGARRALEAASAVAGGQGASLFLSGPPGTGKTHLAVGIMAARYHAWLEAYPSPYVEELRPDGRSSVTTRPNFACRFVVVPSFLDRLRAAARYTQAEDPLPPLFTVELLVLDDLGAEKTTDWASERLYVLVNERYNRMLPTIATSNETPDELVARGYGPLVSRLVEGGAIVMLTADDYRKAPR